MWLSCLTRKFSLMRKISSYILSMSRKKRSQHCEINCRNVFSSFLYIILKGGKHPFLMNMIYNHNALSSCSRVASSCLSLLSYVGTPGISLCWKVDVWRVVDGGILNCLSIWNDWSEGLALEFTFLNLSGSNPSITVCKGINVS